MRIQLARNIFISGEPHSAGDVVEVDDNIGRALLLLHRGSPVDAPAGPAAEVATVGAPENMDARPNVSRRRGG